MRSPPGWVALREGFSHVQRVRVGTSGSPRKRPARPSSSARTAADPATVRAAPQLNVRTLNGCAAIAMASSAVRNTPATFRPSLFRYSLTALSLALSHLENGDGAFADRVPGRVRCRVGTELHAERVGRPVHETPDRQAHDTHVPVERVHGDVVGAARQARRGEQ